VRQQLLRVPDVNKVELFGVQDEKVFEVSQKTPGRARAGPEPGAGATRPANKRLIETGGERPERRSMVQVCRRSVRAGAVRAMPIRGNSGRQFQLDIDVPTSGAALPIPAVRCTIRAGARAWP
jgi:hypothetical protein